MKEPTDASLLRLNVVFFWGYKIEELIPQQSGKSKRPKCPQRKL